MCEEYVYLASPYSHAEEAIREERFRAAERASAWFLQRRNWNYSPIVYCHKLAGLFALPTDAGYWKEYNEAMLIYARALYVLTLPGWRESRGTAHEVAFARQEGILVRYVVAKGDEYEVRSAP